MKTLMAAVLAVAAIGANVAFAEEDDGIVSAAPAIADPVNPQQGMLANAYRIEANLGNSSEWNSKTSLTSLDKAPSVKSFADKATAFSHGGVPKGVEVDVMRWDGFIKCKRVTSYTFSFNNPNRYTVYVNGKMYANEDHGQKSCDIDLKLGWNKITLVQRIYNAGDTLKVQYRPKGSMSDPRPLSPGMMFYDKPVEEEW